MTSLPLHDVMASSLHSTVRLDGGFDLYSDLCICVASSSCTAAHCWSVVPLHTAGSFWFSLLLPNTVQTATSQMATSRKRLSSILVSMRLSWELSSRCTYVLTCWSCLVPGQLLEFCWPQGQCKIFNLGVEHMETLEPLEY